MSTNYDFKPYDEANPIYKEIDDFIKSIQPSEKEHNEYNKSTQLIEKELDEYNTLQPSEIELGEYN